MGFKNYGQDKKGSKVPHRAPTTRGVFQKQSTAKSGSTTLTHQNRNLVCVFFLCPVAKHIRRTVFFWDPKQQCVTDDDDDDVFLLLLVCGEGSFPQQVASKTSMALFFASLLNSSLWADDCNKSLPCPAMLKINLTTRFSM
jgi:hypothetical protein